MTRFYSILSCLLAAMLGVSVPAACCCPAVAGIVSASHQSDACCGNTADENATRDRACCPKPDQPTCCEGKTHHDNRPADPSKKDGCCKLSAPCRDAERPTRVAVKADRPSHPTHDALLLIVPLPAFAWLEPSALQHLAATSPPLDQPPNCSLLKLGCLLTT